MGTTIATIETDTDGSTKEKAFYAIFYFMNC